MSPGQFRSQGWVGLLFRDETLVILQRRLQQLLAQRLQARQRRFEQCVLADLREVVIDGLLRLPEVGVGAVTLLLRLGPLAFDAGVGLPKEYGARGEAEDQR